MEPNSVKSSTILQIVTIVVVSAVLGLFLLLVYHLGAILLRDAFTKGVTAIESKLEQEDKLGRCSFIVTLSDVSEKSRIDNLITECCLTVVRESPPRKTGVNDRVSYAIELEGYESSLRKFGNKLSALDP